MAAGHVAGWRRRPRGDRRVGRGNAASILVTGVTALAVVVPGCVGAGSDDGSPSPASTTSARASPASRAPDPTGRASDVVASPDALDGSGDAGGELTVTDEEVGQPAAPTSRDLIAAAVTTGELDEATALQYRVFAQFGDPALPGAYTGVPGGHDPAALAAARQRLDELPADIATAVEPYLRRPTDPDSAYAAPVGEAAGPGTSAMTSGKTLVQPVNAPPPGIAQAGSRRPCGTWDSATIADTPFRVWACETEDVDADLDALFDPFATLAGPVADILAPLPDGMGPLVPDEPDSGRHPDEDDRIDIYVLDQGWLAPARGGDPDHLRRGQDAGLTVVTAPFPAQGSSGYMLVDRGLLDDPAQFQRTIVHEVFHLAQLAHNVNVVSDYAWITEGTATWAEAHFVPSDSAQVHANHFTGLQLGPDSLTADAPASHPYETYAWPLFMEQQTGPQSIFGSWDAFGRVPAPSRTKVLDILSSFVPVSASLPEFAMRLVNARPNGNPIPTRFVHLDPNFPDDAMPPLGQVQRTHVLDGDPVVIDYATWDGPRPDDAPALPPGVPPLAWRFDHVQVPGAGDVDNPIAVEVTADQTLQQHADTTTLEALVRDERGRYERTRIDLADGASFCGSEVLFLVLTNTSRTEDVGGTATVDVSDDPVCALAGNVFLEFAASYEGPPDEIPFSEEATMELRGALDVQVGPPEDEQDVWAADPGQTRSVYPDNESSWIVRGRYRHDRCAPGGGNCLFWTTQDFGYKGAVASGGGSLEVTAHDGEVTLHAVLPVEVTTTVKYSVDLPAETTTSTQYWALGCKRDGWGWGQGPDYVTALSMDDGLVGEWTDDRHTTITFDCQADWEPSAYSEADESGTASLVVEGEVDLEAPD